MVIFGITGDLAHRKLIPSLYHLVKSGQLPGPLTLVGFARRNWKPEQLADEFRQSLAESLEGEAVDDALLRKLFDGAQYVPGDFTEPERYADLRSVLEKLPASNVLFYLATPPEAYPEIVQNLGKLEMHLEKRGWSRIVVEKPYGNDLQSAVALDEQIHRVFSEKQIYRIDHYLGKDTVQNILVLRFANAIFEPVWNNHFIDHVQIMVAESLGVGSRTQYYDSAGVIRDIFQNHLLQLLCLVAMEVPVAFRPDAVRDEKLKVLDILRPMKEQEVLQNTVRGQYTAGEVLGEKVAGYRKELGRDSLTETYMAARVYLDNWRWAGVPFYLRSGKRLPERLTQISVHFQRAPIFLFDWCHLSGNAPNVLTINVQPNEGIDLSFGAKIPGQTSEIAPVRMHFDYAAAFGKEPPEAYRRLLLDAMTGDPTLFTRSDEVRAAWAFTTRIIEAWQQHQPERLPAYAAGTWGPPEAEELMRRDGREWMNHPFPREPEC
ncbi:MAG TPA: glucose-6-phosphate dehydrogenase [Anaerolineaceae bacterium]